MVSVHAIDVPLKVDVKAGPNWAEAEKWLASNANHWHLGGSGQRKKHVARQFARLGARVLDADRTAHEVLRLPHVEAAAHQRWGKTVFGRTGGSIGGDWPPSCSPGD